MNMNSGGFGGLGMGRPGGGGGNWTSNGTGLGGGGGHCIHMRGLPFRATRGDIADVRLFEIPVFNVC
jgi:heterogeneous nuclear ribonucleoprotein F/H